MPKARFATFARLLLDLGFTARTEGAPHALRPRRDGTRFVYPAYDDGEELFDYDLMGTRYILDAKGILPREQFDERLEASVAAG